MRQMTFVSVLDKKESEEGLCLETDFAHIFETYYKKIYNYIYYRVNCQYTAEDLVSQVFEKAMIKINTYAKEKSPFEVWLFIIAKNTLHDYFRRSRKYSFLSMDTIKEFISKRRSPEDMVEISETRDKLLLTLNSLNPRERNIVSLKFGGELKNVEIAEVLNLSESNVGVILYRAMKKLKRELEKEV
ncbi:sigma-70 family RNA polymerase sigma factor [Clostridiaceae bacterium 35-E11]